MDQMADAYAASSVPPGRSDGPSPLEPLRPDEILAVVAIVRQDADFAHNVLFETIELLEPSLDRLRAGTAAREARANVFRNEETGIWRLTVSLPEAAVVTGPSWQGRGR